jgi:hypothetical protein
MNQISSLIEGVSQGRRTRRRAARPAARFVTGRGARIALFDIVSFPPAAPTRQAEFMQEPDGRKRRRVGFVETNPNGRSGIEVLILWKRTQRARASFGRTKPKCGQGGRGAGFGRTNPIGRFWQNEPKRAVLADQSQPMILGERSEPKLRLDQLLRPLRGRLRHRIKLLDELLHPLARRRCDVDARSLGIGEEVLVLERRVKCRA